MKLKVTASQDFKHLDTASSVGWATTSELYSIGDDHVIIKWDLKTSEGTEVAKLPKDVYCTDIHWFPGLPGKKQTTVQSELFALACTDGKVLLASRSGRVEKSIEGHKGAVLGIKWAHDGTALLTFGEDGTVKIWSKTGMLRSVLVQNAIPVYSASWSPDCDSVLYTAGKSLVIKPLQPSTKPTQWKSHDGIVLAVDWNQNSKIIISGGEDRKYKIWNCFGQMLYSSISHDCPLTSLAWTPDGELFAVSGFNTLRLCDKAGWSYSLDKPQCGTIFKMAWSSDGTQLGGASGSGQIIMARIVERRMDWCHLEAVVTDENRITVRNSMNDSKEYLVFNERITKTSLDWNHLVVTTMSQCYIYSERNWTTPISFDLKVGAVSFIKQAERFFMLNESFSGIQIISYEGRVICTLKYQGDSLNRQSVSLSQDVVAIKDKKDSKIVHFFDAVNGKETGNHFKHELDIEQIHLSQSSGQRFLAFTDKNNDLFLINVKDIVKEATKPIKIGSMVTSIAWNNQYNMLVGMMDNQLMVWYSPNVVFTDPDLLSSTTLELKGSYSKNPQIVTFIGNNVTLRRSDGAIVMSCISPFPAVLHQHMLTGQWSDAVKLCRIAKDPALWACLAGLSAGARELSTSIISYSAIDEVDKVQYLSYIQNLKSAELRNAELALFYRQTHEAENLLIQSGMIFKAIEMHMQLFQWERALEIAVNYKTHVDTVLAFRQKYLEELGTEETMKKFQQYNEKVSIDWEKVISKVATEHEKVY